MKKRPKVSVVVPIYKVEKFIHQAVDSILNQTLKDLEIILVDDGSPDNCGKICDEYAAKDDRVKVIHQPNGGLGNAYNNGVAAATGEYIGFVEPDDFIEFNMYEELYNKATMTGAEMVVGSWYYHNDTTNISDTEIKQNSSEQELFNILDYPFLLTIHPSVWAKLYKTESIKDIRFPEFKGAGYCDAPFIVQIYCKLKKIIAIHKPLYFYRTDNMEASSNNARKDKSLIGIIQSWQVAKNVIKEYGLYNQLKEELYFHSIKPCFRFFCNIDKKYKKEFFTKFRAFILDLKNDETFHYKYFKNDILNSKRKMFIQFAIHNDFKSALALCKYDKISYVKIFGVPILKKTQKGNTERTFIFGIPIIKKTKLSNSTNLRIFYIFSINKEQFQTNYYVGRLRLYKKNNNLLLFQSILKKMDVLNDSVLNLKTNILASKIHSSIFAKYKNIYEGKDVVVVACGPTAKEYVPIENAIHIAINRAFYMSNINFNYIFANDAIYPEGDQKLREYNKNCIKFLGLLPDRFLFNKEIYRHQPDLFNAANTYPFILEFKANNIWAYDIANEPFGDFNSTVFSALQFVLYTNPKRIYLVGCDCTSGYFYDSNESKISSRSSNLINKWKTFKSIKDKFYPNTEIVSINPIGLKGFFKDIYISKLENKNE